MATAMIKPSRTEMLARALPILTVIAAFAYAGVAYMLLFFPRIGPLLPGGWLDLSSYEQRVAADRVYLNQLATASSSYRDLNPDLKSKIENTVPIDQDVPGIDVQLDTIAGSNGFVLLSIDSSPDDKFTSSANRRAVRVAFTVAGGSYEQFKSFLADIERSERLFDVENIIFTPTAGSYNVVLRAYYLDVTRATRPDLAAQQKQP